MFQGPPAYPCEALPTLDISLKRGVDVLSSSELLISNYFDVVDALEFLVSCDYLEERSAVDDEYALRR